MDVTDAVRLAGGVFDSDGNPADGDLTIRGAEVDGRRCILVSTTEAFPLELGDVQLAVPLDVVAILLADAGYSVTKAPSQT